MPSTFPSFRSSEQIFCPLRIMMAILPLILASCAASLSGQLSGPDLSPASLTDARINVTRLDVEMDDDSSPDQPASMILVPDDDGSFATNRKLSPGRYLVEALVPGYEPVSRQLDLKEPQEVKLSLVPLGKAKARTSDVNEDAAVSRGAGGATLTLPQF